MIDCEKLTQRTAPAPARFTDDSRYSTVPRDNRISDHVAMRRPSSFQDDVEETPKAAKSSALGQSSSRPSKSAGPLDAWLHTATVDVHIARAAKVLSAVDEGVSDAITSQIQELSEVNAQLSLKLRVARHEATTLKRKLTCAETAIRNLRMHVACKL
jgi:hypothetical protein